MGGDISAVSIVSIVIGFAIFGSLLWLVITCLLGVMSGWLGLREAYADNPNEPAIERFGGVSGSMGRFPPGGVQYGFGLTIDVCESGMRLSAPRFLSPLSRPVIIPWKDIKPEKAFGYTRLVFGEPEVGILRLRNGLFDKISASAPDGALASA